MNDNSLVWVDIETTGLDETTDLILEVGVILTDAFGNIDHKWASIVTPSRPALESRINSASVYVKEMHRNNNLLAQIESCQGMPQFKSEAVRDTMMDFLHSHLPDANPPMCGSSVHFDRNFLQQDLPEVAEWFSYRNIDVSSIKEICNRVNPLLASKRPEGRKKHRVIPDLEDTIEEYRFYLENFFFTEV